MATKTKVQWCVYADTLRDATGRTYAPGDGITRSSRRIYGIADSREEAERTKARLEGGRLLSRARIPGDSNLYPELEVGEYDPMDFVGSQARRQGDWEGKRYPILCRDLAEAAERNASEIS